MVCDYGIPDLRSAGVLAATDHDSAACASALGPYPQQLLHLALLHNLRRHIAVSSFPAILSQRLLLPRRVLVLIIASCMASFIHRVLFLYHLYLSLHVLLCLLCRDDRLDHRLLHHLFHHAVPAGSPAAP